MLLVPDGAVVSDQARKILFAVGPDNKVAPKPVTLGPIALGLRAVTAGLSPDDKVIIGGLANPFVRPGAVVRTVPGEIKAVEARTAASDPRQAPPAEARSGPEAKAPERPASN